MATAYDIIKRPVITEQSMSQTEGKKYTFEVAKDANKIEIAKAIEEIFGVKVSKVNTLNMRGKEKRTGRYPAGRRASWKKAMVTLTADSKTIEFFEGMV
ncbi:50S ribosomal protein L23 [bioreactor metagenome]|uniref:50S ribosomal protein L23 n=1 Tax=bioreactor metagenome TaxID=1076179 RepID=A0A645AKH4_9ZZZZ